VRKESQLVRAEIGEKVSALGRAAGFLGAGAALLLGAFLCVLVSLILALSKVIDPLLATLIVAAAAAISGLLLVRLAIQKMKPAELIPERSTQQLRKDVDLVRGEASVIGRSGQ
jgi:hypothetical protein